MATSSPTSMISFFIMRTRDKKQLCKSKPNGCILRVWTQLRQVWSTCPPKTIYNCVQELGWASLEHLPPQNNLQLCVWELGWASLEHLALESNLQLCAGARLGKFGALGAPCKGIYNCILGTKFGALDEPENVSDGFRQFPTGFPTVGSSRGVVYILKQGPQKTHPTVSDGFRRYPTVVSWQKIRCLEQLGGVGVLGFGIWIGWLVLGDGYIEQLMEENWDLGVRFGVPHSG